MRYEYKGWRGNEMVRRIVLAAFPDYRRPKVTVVQTDSVTFHDLNWSGGTRSEYRFVDSSTFTCEGDTSHWSAKHPTDNAAEGKTVKFPEGIVVVRGGVFCGKTSMLYIYAHEATIKQMGLPS